MAEPGEDTAKIDAEPGFGAEQADDLNLSDGLHIDAPASGGEAAPLEVASLSTPVHDFDASVGFASTDALAGRPVTPEPAAFQLEPDVGDQPELDLRPSAAPLAVEPISMAAPETAPPRLAASPEAALVTDLPPLSPEPRDARPDTAPILPPAPVFGRSGRERPEPPPADDRLLWAYTVYALILFAVPTAGVSAVIGVLAVTGRALKAEEPLKSHYVFQQRTLWTAAVVAIIGVVLIAVGLGTFILFLLAVWMIFRGAWGVFRLKAGRPIDNPRSWLV